MNNNNNNSFFNNVNSSTNPEPINSNSFIQFEPNNGYDNNSTINNSINMQSNLNSTNNSIINDEELLKSFIGNNYDKITKKPFNFAGFFFTTFYMFYRKMFLYGLFGFVINLILLNIVTNPIISLILVLLVSLLVGLLINKIYLCYAKRKVNKIKLNNAQKSMEEIKGICSIKGGTSIGKIFIGFLVEICIALLLLIIMSFIGLKSMFGDLFSSVSDDNKSNLKDTNDTNNSQLGTNDTYEGMLMFDNSINISDKFSITVPSIFEDNSDEYGYSYEYSSDQGVFDKCRVELNIPFGYSSADNLIGQIADYNASNNATEVATIKINDINWRWVSYNDAFGATYYYGTTIDNKVYLLKYEVQEDASSDCAGYREIILNSIIKK